MTNPLTKVNWFMIELVEYPEGLSGESHFG
jgi:hypothetical protein